MPKQTQTLQLTDVKIRNEKGVHGVVVFLADTVCPGLRVRVTPTSKTFLLWRRIRPTDKGPTGRAIGEVGVVTLDEARQTARAWIGLLKTGRDPAQVEAERLEAEARARAAAAAKANNTVRAAWLLYEKAIAHQRQADKVAQIFKAEILPVLGDVPLHELKRAQVRDLVRAIARRTVHQAFATFSNLRTFLGWCRDEEIWDLEAVPTDGMKAHRVIGRKKQHRKRVLTDDELFAFWRATRPERWRAFNAQPLRRIRGQMQRVSILYPDRAATVAAARVLLLSGARLNEICQAERRELNPEGTVITVPPARFKSDEQHSIFLPADAQAIIADLPRRNKSTYLFTDDGEAPVRIWTKDRRRIDKRMLLTLKTLARLRGHDPKAVTLPPFVLHDLRRTTRTRLAALKVPSEIAEMVIGHGQRGITRVYDQHQYSTELALALEGWAALLKRIVSKPAQAQVIDMAARRA